MKATLLPTTLLSLGIILVPASAGDAEARPATKPNFIYILADDLGYGELGCYGQKILKTPHIDRLAAEGMRFSRHYSGSTVCAPSRSAFLEGRHTGHCSVRGNQPPHLSDPSITTLPEALKAAGYATGIVGKWGVGHPPPPDDPLRHGFDFAYGYINMWHAHNFFPEFLYRSGEKVLLEGNVLDRSLPFNDLPEGTGVAKAKVTYAPDRIEREALAFIERNRDRPFFLYLALNLPHENGEAKQAQGDGNEVPDYGVFADRDWPVPHRGYARMVQHVDETVGRVDAVLKQFGLHNRTLVAFSSDNGPHTGTANSLEFFDRNGPLRGGKRDLYEGGIRVPLIVRWPGRVAAGSTSDHVSAMWDLFPTVAEAAGAPVPAGIDGISFLPTLLGRSGQRQHPYLYWEFYEQGGKQAALRGDWKLVRTHVRDAQPVVTELFNLAEDEGESRDVASRHPDTVRELGRLMEEAHEPIPVMSLFRQ